MCIAPLIIAVMLGGCATVQSESPPPVIAPPQHDDSDFSAEGSPVEKDPPSQDEMAKGYTFRDIYKPVQQSCDDWLASVKQAEAYCAKSLFVDGCGEKDDAGKPTGQYRNNDCPTCETLAALRLQAKAAGCVS